MQNIQLVIGGLVVFLIGLIVAGVVIDTAATTGANTNLTSFAGAGSINDLLVTIFYIGLLITGLGAMGVGMYRTVRETRGPKGRK